MHEQPPASMLQGNEDRAAGEATNALPEPLNTRMYADWAIEREPAAAESVNAFMGNWGPAALNLARNQFIVNQRRPK
eukprot:2998336-Pyramimonas_sp.AAC.1